MTWLHPYAHPLVSGNVALSRINHSNSRWESAHTCSQRAFSWYFWSHVVHRELLKHQRDRIDQIKGFTHVPPCAEFKVNEEARPLAGKHVGCVHAHNSATSHFFFQKPYLEKWKSKASYILRYHTWNVGKCVMKPRSNYFAGQIFITLIVEKHKKRKSESNFFISQISGIWKSGM